TRARAPARVLEQLLVMWQHGGARSRRTDDRVGAARFEDLDQPPRERPRLVTVPSVERRVPATGLALVELYGAPRPPQHLDGADGRRRPELVRQTGHEQRYAHRRSPTEG